jgi:hypothetical protein
LRGGVHARDAAAGVHPLPRGLAARPQAGVRFKAPPESLVGRFGGGPHYSGFQPLVTLRGAGNAEPDSDSHSRRQVIRRLIGLQLPSLSCAESTP